MRPGDGTPSVCAITVTHHPDRDALRSLVGGISPQVDGVVVIDNASHEDELPELSPVTVLRQPANIGLAAAQNIGVAWARAHGHTHVLLLDQDSSPAPDMVAQLLAALAQLTADGRRVAAVGPRFHDQREDRDAPFVRVAFPVSEKIWCGTSPYVECDFLIGSGALIPIAVLDDVGAMDQSLFIDNIDLEWSFRSRSRGYTLFGVCAARMDHRLGDDRRPVLFGLRQVVTHGPTRLYYIMRNRTILYRLASTPRVWIAQDLLRIPFKFVIFAVLLGPRRRNAAMMLAGLRDGLRGRGGPIPTWRHA
jgi:rhamnosyltransferase